jgi:hypothetical protein
MVEALGVQCYTDSKSAIAKRNNDRQRRRGGKKQPRNGHRRFHKETQTKTKNGALEPARPPLSRTRAGPVFNQSKYLFIQLLCSLTFRVLVCAYVATSHVALRPLD